MYELSKSHSAAITICREVINLYEDNPQASLSIDFDGCEFIYPDYASLFICTLKYLDHLGYTVSGTINLDENSNPGIYLAGMKFFEHLNTTLPFKIKEADSQKSVVIQHYNSENQLEVLNHILKILREKSSLDDNVYTGLDYCFNEILDNVLNHSGTGKGLVAAQYFESLNSIRLIVCDYGMGIYESLRHVYNYTEDQAMLNCIVSGITNGKGQGHGLYATSTFVKLNKGWLSIISGNKILTVSENETKLTDIDKWQGTAIYIRINTNVSVDYKEFTSKNYDYKAELFESLFE